MLIGGEPLESCLRLYPQQASELRPLLELAASAHRASAIAPSPDFRARARYQFRAALNEAVSKKTRTSFRWSWRLATVVPVVIALLLISSVGVAVASQNSLPDQPLYQVKLAVEQVQLRLTPSDSGKAELYARMADRRVSEIVAMAQKGNAALTEATTRRLEADLNMVKNYAIPGGQQAWHSPEPLLYADHRRVSCAWVFLGCV